MKRYIQTVSVTVDDEDDEDKMGEELFHYLEQSGEDVYQHDVVTEEESEVCNECGVSVAFGIGGYVNRVPDLNSIITRIQMGKPYPLGDYICARCEAYNRGDDNEIDQGKYEWWADISSITVRADTNEEAYEKAQWLIRRREDDCEITDVVQEDPDCPSCKSGLCNHIEDDNWRCMSCDTVFTVTGQNEEGETTTLTLPLTPEARDAMLEAAKAGREAAEEGEDG